MFKECAVGPERRDRNIRSSIISAVVLAIVASTPILFAPTMASAKPSTADSCSKKQSACVNRCLAKYSSFVGRPGYADKVQSCSNRTCQKQYDNCMKDSVGGGSGGRAEPTPPPPKGRPETLPPTGGVKDEPKQPRTGESTTPTGGTKADPKTPPKANDTRPPIGGGVFQPRTSGGGNDGPILHSGGSPGPILKSNGGNGPSLRSGGRN